MGADAKTVLIIDDDEKITRTFARILERKGYRAETATSGKEAIEKTRTKAYDVALIDICLSDMNGIELLGRLEAHGGRMVKIIITGFPTMPQLNSAAPDACLLKPVKPQELLATIEEKTKKLPE
jgi:DNA-binding NtrC family response regulator